MWRSNVACAHAGPWRQRQPQQPGSARARVEEQPGAQPGADDAGLQATLAEADEAARRLGVSRRRAYSSALDLRGDR